MKPGNEVRLLCLGDKERGKLDNVLKVLQTLNLKSSWITKNDAMKAEKEDDVIYVVEPTEGKIVNHLVEKGCSVIGSQCALAVLEETDVHLNKSLTFPIISLVMMDTLVCFSNIKPKMRNYLIDMVKKMGGRVESELTQYVTHLVVKEVGSAKYFGAARHNIPIMTIEWIRHLWKIGKEKYVCAKKESWDDFVCPLLLGCSICVTGFNFEDREEIRRLVEKFGGSYSGAMKLDVTTHLIVKKAEGAKYEMAGKFGVKVVSRTWLLDSIEKGSCQDHNKYPVKPEGQKEVKLATRSSTPEPQTSFSRAQPLNDMSCISVMAVNETEQSMDVSCMSSQINRPFARKPIEQSQTSTLNAHDLMNFKPSDISSDQLLDGVCAFYTGFKSYEEDHLKNLLNLAGGTRCMQITSQITHVLIGPRTPDTLSIDSITSLLADGCAINVVKYQWLLDSLRRGELINEDEYWPSEVLRKPSNDMNGGGDMLENNDGDLMMDHDMADPDETAISDMPSMRRRHDHESYQNTTVQETRYCVNEAEDTATANKSQHDEMAVDEKIGDSTLLRNYEEVEEENRNAAANTLNKPDATFTDSKMDDSEQDSLTDSSRNPRVLRNKTLMILGWDDHEEEMEELMAKIEWMGAQLVPAYTEKADIAVVPMNGSKVEKSFKLLVTGFWIESCIINGNLMEVDSHPLNTPFNIADDCTILKGTCICLSKYEEHERTYLVELIKLLGGKSQSNLARKNLPSSGLLKTTHLVVENPAGDKYNASINWKIPIVTSQWIYACARSRKLVDETPYNPKNTPTTQPSTSNATYSLPEITQSEDEGTSTKCMGPPSTSTVVKRTSKDSCKPPGLQFKPMPRPPSSVDRIRNKLIETEKAGNNETPFRDRVLRQDIESPSNFIGIKNTPNTSFDLSEVFEMLGTPQGKRKEIVDELNRNSSQKKYQTPPYTGQRNSRTASTTGFDLDDVFEMLKTPHDQQQQILRQISRNPNTPLSVFVRRLFVKSLKEKPGLLTNEVVLNLSRQFDEVERAANASIDENTAAAKTTREEEKTKQSTPRLSHHSEETLTRRIETPSPSSSNKENTSTTSTKHSTSINNSGFTTLTMKQSGSGINAEDLLTSDIVANLGEDFDEAEFEQENKTNNDDVVLVQPDAAEQQEDDDDNKQLVPVVSEDFLEKEDELEMAPPLAGCVVYVAKKLSKQRERMSEIVNELGGEFRMTYDSSCTHFVFQGKQNDTNREFRSAKKNEDVIVVSPYWLEACSNKKKRVEECEYPHVFNPNKSIEMTGMSSQRVSQSKRSTRSSRCTVSVEPPTVVTRRTRGGRKVSSAVVSREVSQASEMSQRSSVESTMSATTTIDSQEARESIRKALENAASFGLKMEEIARRARKKSPPPSSIFTRKRSTGSESTITPTTSMLMGRAIESKSEYSQDVQVGYDDPVGRMEREKLLKEKRLSLNGSLITVREETDACNENEDPKTDAHDESYVNLANNSTQTPSEEDADKTHVCDDDDDDRLSQLLRDGRKPIFILSSIKPAQKAEYAELIKQLGGTYLTRDYFDDYCTHLVVAHPTRNEKFLASLSTGKFVLHTSYLDACKQAGFFVREDQFEYGNPRATFNFQPKDEMEKSLTDSAYRWRKTLCQQKRKDATPPVDFHGAFHGWKVVFQVSQKYKMSLTRIIKSGGGEVEGYAVREEDGFDFTHAIISSDRCEELSIDLVKSLMEKGIHCCLSDYVAEFLIYHPSPKPELRYIPMAKALKDKLSSCLGLGTKEQSGTPTKRRRMK